MPVKEKSNQTCPAGYPDCISHGVAGVTAFINVEYQGRLIMPLVYPQAIRRWMAGKYLPPGCNEPFPTAGIYTRWEKSTVRAWVEKYLVRKPGMEVVSENAAPTNGDFSPGALEKLDIFTTDWKQITSKMNAIERSEEIESNKMKRAKKYILRTEYEAKLDRLGAILWSRFCRVLEMDLPAGLASYLTGRGDLTPEQVAQIVEASRAKNIAAEDALQKEMEELSKQPGVLDREKPVGNPITESEDGK